MIGVNGGVENNGKYKRQRKRFKNNFPCIYYIICESDFGSTNKQRKLEFITGDD